MQIFVNCEHMQISTHLIDEILPRNPNLTKSYFNLFLAPVGLLVHYVEESLSKIDHYYADFSLSELIDGLTRIASHDINKFVVSPCITVSNSWQRITPNLYVYNG